MLYNGQCIRSLSQSMLNLWSRIQQVRCGSFFGEDRRCPVVNHSMGIISRGQNDRLHPRAKIFVTGQEVEKGRESVCVI